MSLVVVRGLESSCWECQQDTTSVVTVHAEGPQHSDDWLWFEDKHALSLARGLLQRAGKPELAESVKEHFSKTAGETDTPPVWSRVPGAWAHLR